MCEKWFVQYRARKEAASIAAQAAPSLSRYGKHQRLLTHVLRTPDGIVDSFGLLLLPVEERVTHNLDAGLRG